MFDDQNIDLTEYGGEIGMDYNVTVQQSLFSGEQRHYCMLRLRVGVSPN